jgi:hypothetical protein
VRSRVQIETTDSAWKRIATFQARSTLATWLHSAALAVRQDGPDALKNHPDPVVGGMFEYVPFDGGFELRSKLKGRNDQPVTLMAGRRG